MLADKTCFLTVLQRRSHSYIPTLPVYDCIWQSLRFPAGNSSAFQSFTRSCSPRENDRTTALRMQTAMMIKAAVLLAVLSISMVQAFAPDADLLAMQVTATTYNRSHSYPAPAPLFVL